MAMGAVDGEENGGERGISEAVNGILAEFALWHWIRAGICQVVGIGSPLFDACK